MVARNIRTAILTFGLVITFPLPLLALIAEGDLCTQGGADNYSLATFASLTILLLSLASLWQGVTLKTPVLRIAHFHWITLLTYSICVVPKLFSTTVLGHHLCQPGMDEYVDSMQRAYAPSMLLPALNLVLFVFVHRKITNGPI